MKDKKILLVEDDNMLGTIFEMFIEEIGYKLIGMCKNGDEAIKICETTPPDIILMDINIEGDKNGIQTSEIINQRFQLPVVYISGTDNTEKIKECVLDNTYGYIVKPVYKRTLEAVIEFAHAKHIFDKNKNG